MPSGSAYPTSLPTPGTTAGFSQLDGPPPSPGVEAGMSPGPSQPPLGSMAGPGAAQIPSGQLPAEVLTGMVQAGETIAKTLDSFAQMTPDLAEDWGLAKDALVSALAKLLQVGAGPTTPQAAGPNFPGGGFDAGGMSAG